MSRVAALANGHPGEVEGCGCEAVPFVPGETEFAFHEFASRLATRGKPWHPAAFVRHYHSGYGRTVTLRETGHLRSIAEHYCYDDGDEGIFRRLADQIADDARTQPSGPYQFCFCWYFEPIRAAFSHGGARAYGRARLHGRFIGSLEHRGALLSILGQTVFNFRDDFANPKDQGFEPAGTFAPGGSPFAIEGRWTANFRAEVCKDAERSMFPNRT